MDIASVIRGNLLSKIKSDAHKDKMKEFWKSEPCKKMGQSIDYVGVIRVLNEFNEKGIDIGDKSFCVLKMMEEELLRLKEERNRKNHSHIARVFDAFFVKFLEYPVLPAFLMRQHKIGKEKGAVGYLKAVIDPEESIDSPKNRWLIDEFKKNGYPVACCDPQKTEQQIDDYVSSRRFEEQIVNASKPGEFDFSPVSEPVLEVKSEPAEPEPVKAEEQVPKFDYPMLERTRLNLNRDLLAFEHRVKALPCFVDFALLLVEWAALKEWGDKEIEKLCH